MATTITSAFDSMAQTVSKDKASKENYSAEMVSAIKVAYTADPCKGTVEALATQYGKTVRSIVAKLSREGVYKKAEYVTKNGEKPQRKNAHASAIGAILNLSDGEIVSLEKANKTVLEKVFSALANSKPIDG